MVKKQLIMEKALELFAENGFEATSVQQITERCGISKGAFYLHFKSKDELIHSLIDQFMNGFIAEIERVVSEKPTEHLLFHFLYVTFSEFQQQANFAKVFVKEQVLSFNQELLERMHMYMTMLNKIVLSIVQRQFAHINHHMHLDILFTINGLTKSYSELFLIDNYAIDLNKLCQTIVEKVTIVAEHSKIPFITPEYLIKTNVHPTISKERLNELLSEVLEEINEDPVVQESLIMLKEDLNNPNLNNTIVQGLINNIRANSHCIWVAYLYQQYLKDKANK